MTNQNNTTCPVCGAAIPEDAPGGLCPKCVLEGAESAANPSGTSARTATPPSVTEIAPHFPDLEIIELLGSGGMGAVYTARQPQLDRIVALKILSRELAADPAFVERFNREARVLARLNHPNIVTVFDFGTAGPHCYLLMEYVDGVNLRQAMRTGGFTPSEALALVQDICSALKFAHEEGILHRDIKPENVLIDSKGQVKIADFGIAKLLGEGAPSDVTLTLQGSILGSPHYMAPEQFETPGDVDQRADIYSLGVVLYEMLTGELPIGRFAPPSAKAAMDARIDEIVMRTLEKERQARFQTAEEVSTSVDALAQSPPAPPRIPDSQMTGERPAAKFSLASALLTGASLILGAVVFWIVFTLNPMSSAVPGEASATEIAEDLSSRLPKMALAALSVLLFPATALLGFFLGGKALGDIREAGGRKRGLASATFGTLAWPVILLFVLASIPTAFAPAGSGVSIPWWILSLLVLISAILAAVILVRGVVRWAGGVEDSKGGRRHPGFGMALLRALGVAILLPSLGVWILSAFSSAFSQGREEHSGTEPPSLDAMGSSPVSQDVRWRLGQPEITVSITVRPGLRATMQLLLSGNEGLDRNFQLGELTASPDAVRSTLEVGTFLKPDDRKGSIHAMAAVRSGRDSRLIRSSEDLRGWEFDSALLDALTFDSPGRYAFQLAILRKDGREDVANGVLVLEVVVTAPSPGDALEESSE